MNNEHGLPFITTFIREDQMTSKLEGPFRMMKLDFMNLTWIEKEIKKVVEGKIEL